MIAWPAVTCPRAVVQRQARALHDMGDARFSSWITAPAALGGVGERLRIGHRFDMAGRSVRASRRRRAAISPARQKASRSSTSACVFVVPGHVDRASAFRWSMSGSAVFAMGAAAGGTRPRAHGRCRSCATGPCRPRTDPRARGRGSCPAAPRASFCGLLKPDCTCPPLRPRGAEAGAMRLQHHHPPPGARQRQRRPEPGVEACAEDNHIGLDRAGERRALRPGRQACGVPAWRVVAGPVVAVERVHTFSRRCSRSHGEITCKEFVVFQLLHRAVDTAELLAQGLADRRVGRRGSPSASPSPRGMPEGSL